MWLIRPEPAARKTCTSHRWAAYSITMTVPKEASKPATHTPTTYHIPAIQRSARACGRCARSDGNGDGHQRSETTMNSQLHSHAQA